MVLAIGKLVLVMSLRCRWCRLRGARWQIYGILQFCFEIPGPEVVEKAEEVRGL